jgi:hypothetical protein
MYKCVINYHGEDMVPQNITIDINSYNVMKAGENILPEFHIHYNKNIDVAAYNHLEEIALWAEDYTIDSVEVYNAANIMVQGSNNWKTIIGYSCSSGSNMMMPDCLLRLQG